MCALRYSFYTHFGVGDLIALNPLVILPSSRHADDASRDQVYQPTARVDSPRMPAQPFSLPHWEVPA